MSRARTKVAEWWERSNWHGRYTESQARSMSKNAGKLVHVTRYRLAPLVKLAWRLDLESCRLDAKYNGALIASAYVGGKWHIWGLYSQTGKESTLAEAKAACAARLRELGYRVVDP